MAGLFKKILKGILIGGGTVLSLLCPPAGGAVITAGMAIGAGAAAAGALIKTDSAPQTIDTTTSVITDTLTSIGLMQPASYATSTGKTSGLIIQPWVWLVGGVGLLLVLAKTFFKRRR